MSSAVIPIVRVAILADSRLTEIALPADLPLRDILPAVERLVVPAVSDDVVNGSATTDPTTPVRLSLAPIGGAPFSLDASLGTVGVVDGDLLALQPVPVGPAAPGIVEDIADAAVIFSTSRLKPWGSAHIQRGAIAGLVGLLWTGTGLGVTHRLITGSPIGLFAVAALAVLTVVAGFASRSPRAGAALSAAALVPVAAALALAVPGSFGAAQITLAAAGVTAWSLISLILPRRESDCAIALFTATAVRGCRCARGRRCEIAVAAAVGEPGRCADCGGACSSPSKPRNCPRCGPASRCRSFRHPATRRRRRRRRGCSPTCRDGSGSATRTRPDSSRGPYCSARWDHWRLPGSRTPCPVGAGMSSPQRRPRPHCGPGCGTRPHAKRGCWLSLSWWPRRWRCSTPRPRTTWPR